MITEPTPYLNRDRTETVPLPLLAEGQCESGASLECDLDNPNRGIMRTLPESMLPNSEPVRIIQCLPCYEASAEAYIRKYHNRRV